MTAERAAATKSSSSSARKLIGGRQGSSRRLETGVEASRRGVSLLDEWRGQLVSRECSRKVTSLKKAAGETWESTRPWLKKTAKAEKNGTPFDNFFVKKTTRAFLGAKNIPPQNLTAKVPSFFSEVIRVGHSMVIR